MYHMNGEQVQGYSRFRHDECSDPCRTKRQQQVMRILAQKLTRDKLNDLTHVGQLIGVFRRDVTTNMSTDELKALAWTRRSRISRTPTRSATSTRRTPSTARP